MIEYLDIGKVVNTHGVKGEIKVIPLTDNPHRYEELKWVYIDKDNELQKYNIQGIKHMKNMVLVKLEGVDDMEAAQSLRDAYLKVDRKNAVKLPKDSYFICDLIGSSVYDEDGNKLGELKNVLKTGSNDVYVVRNEDDGEILVPALKTVVKEISVEKKKIVVSLPEGLVDDEV